MTDILTSNLGYPRIGEKREWKQALELYWNGSISEQELLERTEALRLENLKKQKEAGIDLVPVGDFSFYDHVLDTSAMFGVIPERYNYDGGQVDFDTYFAIARGVKDAYASEMTKWFNTNYHYIVPELENIRPTVTENLPLKYYNEAKEKLGIDGKPVILGPITYLKLSKGYKEEEFSALLQSFIPLYIQILKELEEAGATWVQVDEPIFSTIVSDDLINHAHKAYESINNSVPSLNILLQTYFEHIPSYQKVIDLPVQGIGLDFVHGDSLSLLKEHGFPSDKVLAVGIVDGRNVWRTDLEERIHLFKQIKKYVKGETIIIQPSSSLLHVPVTKENESKLEPVIKDILSFADEKLIEVALLRKGLASGEESIREEINKSTEARNKFQQSKYRNEAVTNNTDKLTEEDARRSLSFAERLEKQKKQLQLPILPTTTIGSLPQTAEVKQTRRQWRNGEITSSEYEQFIKDNIKKWIALQNAIGLDVLVHGEFERTDMVEYFGEKLNGIQVTQNGWVQSYGSRCVKPPLIVGDVSFDQAMTLNEITYAQSLTDKPVKGMLTGPTTILNWSFVHDHLPRYTVLNQIALALKEEVKLIEEAGIRIIQVDEPALREGLPLDPNKWSDYLNAAVYGFKLTVSSVQSETQIHTHMCYSDFQNIFETINALDADVISIETSKSHGEIISTFEENTYNKGIGLGVYDIHSPRIPSKDEIIQNIKRPLQSISPKQFWINPDCGLKTRKEDETIEALKIMVKAAKVIRESQLSKLS